MCVCVRVWRQLCVCVQTVCAFVRARLCLCACVSVSAGVFVCVCVYVVYISAECAQESGGAVTVANGKLLLDGVAISDTRATVGRAHARARTHAHTR
jgi:hypothetical protein